MYYTKAQVSEKSEDSFTAVASSEAEDRQGERVLQSGWQLKNFKDNPILLFMHDHTKPIGKATRVWIDKMSNRLMFKGVISTATDVGRAAKQLMDEGILNSFSVGFRPLEMDGNVISKSELYEISLVTVPANPEARLVAAKSLQDAGFGTEVIDEVVGREGDKDAIIEELKTELAKAYDTAALALEKAELAVKGLQHLNPHRSNHEVVNERLRHSKIIAKAADKLLDKKPVPHTKTVSMVKVIKRSSEMLIRSHKADL